MAGQPQDNSWTHQGPEYSQGAPGYGPGYDQQGQPAPYPQQEQAYDQQPGGYQPTQVYEQQAYQQAPVYEQQPQFNQAGQQPSFDAAGQPAYGQPSQAYPGQPQPFEQQARPGQPQGPAQGQPGWDQWQLPKQQQARQQKQSRPPREEHGFVSSLFDFGFTSFVTPRIIKVLYVLVTLWTILWALAFLRLGFHYGGMGGGLGTLIIVDPILILVSLGVFRVVLEFFMVTFRMQEDLKALRERSAGPGQSGGDGETVVDNRPADGV